MCGRLNVKEDPLNKMVSEALGIHFAARENIDLRPTQLVSTIATEDGRLSQRDISWGIKPQWAKRVIINAQAETVAEKPTFRKAFREQRCAVPCTGWYEWCEIPGKSGKSRISFEREDRKPVYMAGICIEAANQSESGLVTLTCPPDAFYRAYHHRLPLLLDEECVSDWVLSSPEQALQHLIAPNIALQASASSL